MFMSTAQKVLRATSLAIAMGGIIPPVLAQAPAEKSYLWAEADSTLHQSTRLQDVPEPYASIYRAKGSTVLLARGTNAAAGAEGQRASWQARKRALQEKLLQATEAFAKTKSDDEALDLNPVLRLTPMVQAQHEAGAKALADAQAAFLAAYKALVVTFAEEAKRASVPPGWLQ